VPETVPATIQSCTVYIVSLVRLAARNTGKEISNRNSAMTSSPTSRSTQDLHCIKPDYIDPNINIKLYDYIKLRQDHR
jgi:hypothetical protein